MRSLVVDRKHGVELVLDSLPAYGYAACLAELHPVYGIERAGGGGGPAPTVEVRLPEIDYRVTLPLRDGRIGTGGDPLPPRVATLLESLARRTNAHLRVSVSGVEAAKLRVTILPASEWPHAPEFRTLAAAHVLPGDDAVFRTLIESSQALRSRAEGLTLPELVRSESEDAARIALETLYAYLASRCEVAYEEPQVDVDPWCDVSCQKVRAPHEVVGSGNTRSGKGNCLDVSLFLASCLESLSLQPLIVFTGEPERSPSHAFLGCWTDGGRRFRPLLADGAALLEKARGEELVFLEATGVCTGGHRLAFDEACRAGLRHVEEAASIHAVDVCATRPPHGDVRPLRLANAPIVQQACWKGEELRESVGAEARETLHVLYGLCAVEGEATCRLFASCESSAQRVRKIIESSLPREGHSGPGRETNNYRLCLEAARLNARNREALVVEESDLLWAVLDSPSRNVRKVLAAAGCDHSVLLAALSRQWTRPRQVTVSRFFGPAASG
jgi:hypothetical protein